MTLGVIGLGLIGTSIARAALQRGACDRVVGFDPNPEHASAFSGFEGCVAIGDACDAELLVIATPPDRVLPVLERLDPRRTSFDVASVKAPILAGLPAAHRASFVGSHPIAGNEGKGPTASDPDLFVGKSWIVTPGRADPERVEEVERFIAALGAEPHRMDAQEHDTWLALTSHLPNLLANALMTLSPEGRRAFEGPSWDSATRVAGGNPELWATILAMNAHPVNRRIDELIEVLRSVQVRLGGRESLEAWLQEARCASS